MPRHNPIPAIATAQAAPAIRAEFGHVDASAMLNVHEVAGLLSVSAGTIWRLAREGTLRPIKIGGSTRWPARVVRTYLEEQTWEAEQRATKAAA